jgi:hypothetical protein
MSMQHIKIRQNSISNNSSQHNESGSGSKGSNEKDVSSNELKQQKVELPQDVEKILDQVIEQSAAWEHSSRSSNPLG